MNGTDILLKELENILEKSLSNVSEKYLFELVTPEVQDFFLKQIIYFCEQQIINKHSKEIDVPLHEDQYNKMSKYLCPEKPWIFEKQKCFINKKEEVINLYIYKK